MATSDPRFLTTDIYGYQVKNRTDFEELEPVSIINQVPINASNPDSRLGRECNFNCVSMNFTIKYNGPERNKWINMYIVKRNQTEDLSLPSPTLDKIMTKTLKDYDGNTLTWPLIQENAMQEINSSTAYSIVKSLMIQTTEVSRGLWDSITLDLRKLLSVYSNDAGSSDNLQKPLTNTLYIYLIADADPPATGPVTKNDPTNVSFNCVYRLCYEA